MRTLTKAEQRVRKAKNHGGKEAWWYAGRGICDFFVHTADGVVVRISIGTREIRGALKQMDKELGKKDRLFFGI
jgi:hypothetical protein